MLFITTIACKNNAQNTDNTNSTQEILTELPDEIANKTWVYINPIEKQWFKTMLEYNDREYIKTETNSIDVPIDLYDPVRSSQKIESITVNDKGYSIKFNKSKKLGGIDFKWLDKSKGLGIWEIKYIDEGYAEFGDTIVRKKSVIKKFITPNNFPKPKPKEEIIIVGEDKPIDSNIYSELIDDLPIEGRFSCKYTEEGETYTGAFLEISNKDYEVENVSNNTIETYKNEIKIKIEDVLYLQCNARKIKSSTNKYALFYKIFYTKYEAPVDSQYYSTTRPIAEIEILDNNTIEKKWLGIYNKRTKQVESINGYFTWGDEFCDIIKRIE